MYEKEVTIEITIPLRFKFEPASPGFYRGQQYSALAHDLDWKDGDIQKEVIKALYDPGLIDELREHAEAENQKAKDDKAIADWQCRDAVEGRR